MHARTFLSTLFLLIALSSVAAALEIQAPENVPMFSPLSLRITLPATNVFTQAVLQFDGDTVATLYPTGACGIQPEWAPFLIHCATFDADLQSNEGLTAIVTYTGFNEGTHTATVSAQGSESETQTLEIHSFQALDAHAREVFDEQLIAMRAEVDATNQAMEQTKQDTYGKTAELQTQLEASNRTIEELQGKIATFEQKEAQKAALEAEAAEKAKQGFQLPFLSGGTGLASGSSAPLIGIVVLVIAGIIAFYFVRVRKGGKTFGGSGGMSKSTPFFEGNMDSLFKGLPGGKASEGNSVDPQPRKFRSEIEGQLREDIDQNPPEKDTKIHYSDLTR